jgi:hypothetical protein
MHSRVALSKSKSVLSPARLKLDHELSTASGQRGIELKPNCSVCYQGTDTTRDLPLMPKRAVKKSYYLCRLTLLGFFVGHGIAAAQDTPSTQNQEAAFSYPPCDRTPTVGDIQGAKGAFQAGEAAYREPITSAPSPIGKMPFVATAPQHVYCSTWPSPTS